MKVPAYAPETLSASITAKFGGFNDVPPNWHEVSEAEFAKSMAFHYEPIATEFRQFIPPGDKTYASVTLYFMHDGTGWAMVNDYWGGKIRFFLFFACDHTMRELSKAECATEGLYHAGRCFHVSKCTKCGYVSSVDSSD